MDKFAQLPRKEELRHIFGCPGGNPPELIIQDELHLISGPLGTVTGLYETCIDWLSTRDGIRPKVIGSTATIGRAKEQVRALFDREVFQFPPAAIDAADSFFAVRDTDASDRSYMGIISSGRSAKFALQAASAALLVIGQSLQEVGGCSPQETDPYWTCLFYFNSLRELGGANVMMRDDVPRSIDFYAHRLGCSPRDIHSEPVELTSRVPSTKIPQVLNDLMFPLYGNPFEGAAVDSVMASNMISVGVDIPRLGLMVVNGQPKSTSEFIQATSRVGRKSPGLVLTVYNACRPRDASHFEHFKSYHQALYRRVEATSVTPWSSRARDKALHAVFAAMVRYLVPGMSDRYGAINIDPAHPVVLAIVEKIVARARSSAQFSMSESELREDLAAIISRWAALAQRYRTAGRRFEYWYTPRPFNQPATPHLMRGAEDSFEEPEVFATPNSMREVEPTAFYYEK